MKKLIAASVLSVVAAAACASNASAAIWPFSLACRDRCTLKVRPYNAFTPACFGTMYCDGCMPVQARAYGLPPANCYGADGCGLGQLPATAGVPAGPVQFQAGQVPMVYPNMTQGAPQQMYWPAAYQPVHPYGYGQPVVPNLGR